MAENLRYLPKVNDTLTSSSTDSCYYVYGYSGSNPEDAKASANYLEYGVLYNWPAAMAASPPGWHLPTEDEWDELIEFVGGEFVSGGLLKETDTIHWNSPNIDATDAYKFAARAGGEFFTDKKFHLIGVYGMWWSSTEFVDFLGVYDVITYNGANQWNTSSDKSVGFSVRCVKD